MGEAGKVIGIEGSQLTVQIQRTEACAKCGICSAGLSSKDMQLSAKNLCAARLGDFVNIELEHSDFLKAVLIMYGVPLMALFCGFMGGFYSSEFLGFPQSPLIGFMSGIIFMCISFLWIKSRESYWKKQNFVPVATKVISDPLKE